MIWPIRPRRSRIFFFWPAGQKFDLSAERELREKVGVTGQLRKIGEVFQSNHATTKFNVFVADQLREAPLPPDEDEHVESCFLPLDAARERLLREQTPAAQVFCAVTIFDADANQRRQ